MKSKLVRMRERKGIWLFDYEQNKYEPRFHYFAYIILGAGALLFGCFLCWTIYSRWDHDSVTALLIALFVPVAMVAFGIMLLPLGCLYFVHRAKGDAVDVWSAEEPDAEGPPEKHHGPDRH